MRIAQISDLHLRHRLLYSGIDPWQALENALLRLAGLVPRPDLLLLSGDLADDGAPDSAYSTPIPPPIPVQTLPAIPDETRHPLHSKPYRPFQSKVGHPFQNKPATQAG